MGWLNRLSLRAEPDFAVLIKGLNGYPLNVASVPILAVAAIHQTIPGIMLAAFCGVCCYMMFVKPTPWQTTDMAYLASAVVLGVAFALIVEPLLVIPTVVMVCGAMAPNAYGNGKITHHPTQR